MRHRFEPITLLFVLLLFALTFLPLSPCIAATPIVDDATFIVPIGEYKSPTGDIDLLILRENYIIPTTNLTDFDDTDPSAGQIVQGNWATFNSPDCIQSILLRIYDKSTSGIYRFTKGTVTFHDGPTSNVQILGIGSDVNFLFPPISPNLDASDSLFNPGVASQLASALGRRLESLQDTRGYDNIKILPSRKSLEFTMRTANGADDIRIILDYGNNNCSAGFPDGITFDVDLQDIIGLSKGIQVGNTDYGEVLSVKGIPLTGTTSPITIAPTRIPDINYFGQTKGRDVYKAYGGDDDNTGIYYFVVDPAIADGTSNPDFYIWIMDADLDKNPASGIDDFSGRTDAFSVFEYILYGGTSARTNDDIISGGNVPDAGTLGDPTDDFMGTVIDINPDLSRTTLRTDLDGMSGSQILKDGDWTKIGVDIDGNPGDPIPQTDGVSSKIFGTGKYVYKLVVDGRDVRGISPRIAVDYNRYQIDVSTNINDVNSGDCIQIRPVINCVVPYAYELTFAGRPDTAGSFFRTNTLILVPDLWNHQVDIQTLDLDESSNVGSFAAYPGALSKLTLPNQTVFDEAQTFESGEQVDITNVKLGWLWTSINQLERNPSTEVFPSVKDGATCGPGPFTPIPALCYDTTNNENAIWKLEIDPVAVQSPFSLRAFGNDISFASLPLIPLPPSPDSDYLSCPSASPCPDGVPDVIDNCPNHYNPTQTDSNGNGIGDACEVMIDTDADGVPDNQDNCPATYNPAQTDSDGDGIGDACDNCPSVNSTSQVDTDGDGLGDLCDNCPIDSNPIATGTGDPNYTLCADGITDNIGQQCDVDQDGRGDLCDNCKTKPNSDQADSDTCQASLDPSDPIDPTKCDINNPSDLNKPLPDGIGDACDNCNSVYNPLQHDTYPKWGVGDACELKDTDGDGIPDGSDNCPNVYNPQGNIPDINGNYVSETCADYDPDTGTGSTNATSQCDVDSDSVGDKCDNCSLVANSDQSDTDGDEDGDVCDNCGPYTYLNPATGSCYNNVACSTTLNVPNPAQQDSDLDGVGDACDPSPQCAGAPPSEVPDDGIEYCKDNCPTVYNPDQKDNDKDGVGNLCDGCLEKFNPDQQDSDGDGRQDACDNCPTTYNPEQADTDLDGRGDACDACPTNPSPTCTPIPIECEIHPETLNKDSSGIPVSVEIEFERDNPYKATDIVINSSTFIEMRFPEPTPVTCTASLNGNGEHYLPHIAGTEQYGSRKLHVKFDRNVIESCVNVSTSPPSPPDHRDINLRISGMLRDGNEFTCHDEVWVIKKP